MQNNNHNDIHSKSKTEAKQILIDDRQLSTVRKVIVRNLIANKSKYNYNKPRSMIQKFVSDCYVKSNTDDDLKIKVENQIERKIIKEVKNRKNLTSKKRKKTTEETDTLEAYYKEDPSWTRNTVKNLKIILTNLTVDQIYKWGYDRKLLLKKHRAQKKAHDAQPPPVISSMPDTTLQSVTISDFNQEVQNLCQFETSSSEEMTSESPVAKPSCTQPRAIGLVGQSGSFDGNETLSTAGVGDFTVVEDDPFFYDHDDRAACFYVVFNESGRSAPHRRPGRRGLFRAPSGFVNMDFYTWKECVFHDGGSAFLEELYKED
jgi:hypothetical protein